MFPIRLCVLSTRWQLLLFIALSIVVETVDSLVCPQQQPNNSNDIRYVEIEGVQIPSEKSFLPWVTVNNSDAFSASINETARYCSPVIYFLNGAGLRSFSLFHGWGGHINIYVASLYRTTIEPLSTAESIYSLIQKNENNTINQMSATTTVPDTHILFEFTFLRNGNHRKKSDG